MSVKKLENHYQDEEKEMNRIQKSRISLKSLKVMMEYFQRNKPKKHITNNKLFRLKMKIRSIKENAVRKYRWIFKRTEYKGMVIHHDQKLLIRKLDKNRSIVFIPFLTLYLLLDDRYEDQRYLRGIDYEGMSLEGDDYEKWAEVDYAIWEEEKVGKYWQIWTD